MPFFDVQKALNDGVDPQQIKDFMVANNLQAAPTQPTGLAQSIGSGAINVLKSIASPFLKTGQNLVGGLVQTPLMMQQANAEATARDQNAPDFLRFLAQKAAGLYGGAAKFVQPAGVSEKRAAEIVADPLKAQIEQAKNSAGMLSYAVPFGKGANFVTKALLPGAGVGFLQGVSEENATPTSVLGSTILGAGIGTGLHAAGKVIAPLAEKLGGKTEEVGANIRNATRRITVKPSIYGASTEKEIASTLDKLGITGTPQQQYEKLLPAMQNTGDQIDAILSTESKPIKISSIVEDFNKNLASELRGKELSSKIVRQEASDYIDSLYSASGKRLGNQIESRDLFALKQFVNKDYSRIQAKIFAGTPLTDAEKVQAVARKTFDDIIATNHPNVKALTKMQSNLYDAADSLARSRFNPPTLRVGGTSLPAPVSQAAADLAGRGTQAAGGLLKTAAGKLPPILLNPAVQKAATIVGTLPGQPAPADTTGLGGTITTTPPITPTLPAIQPQYTLDQLAQGYQNAILAGDTAAAAQLKDLYDMQATSQKAQNLSTADQLRHDNIMAALASLDAAEQNLSLGGGAKGPFIGPASNLPVIGQFTNPAGHTYEKTKTETASTLAKAITGTTRVNQGVFDSIMESLPSINDRPIVAAQKMSKLRNDILTQARVFQFNDILNAYQ